MAKTMVSWQAFSSLPPRAPLAFPSRPKPPFHRKGDLLLRFLWNQFWTTELFVCRNKIPAFVNNGQLCKTQKDVFGGHIVFPLSGERSCNSSSNPKSKWFATLNLKINGNNNKQDVLKCSRYYQWKDNVRAAATVWERENSGWFSRLGEQLIIH